MRTYVEAAGTLAPPNPLARTAADPEWIITVKGRKHKTGQQELAE